MIRKIEVLKKRKDFVRVAKGVSVVTPTLVVQAAQNFSDDNSIIRVGYTTTKKIGKATIRNRTRRRMRAVVSEVFPSKADVNTDYVLIGRWNTAVCPFDLLKKNLEKALNNISKDLTK